MGTQHIYADLIADSILPFRIEHSVDEVVAEGELICRYNYLDYHFEGSQGHYVRGRAYFPDPTEVILFGPFLSDNALEDVENPEFLAAVFRYMERRFAAVSRFQTDPSG